MTCDPTNNDFIAANGRVKKFNFVYFVVIFVKKYIMQINFFPSDAL